MNAVADKLREARALIERGWCQNAHALDAEGNETDEQGDSAICYCASGAFWAVRPTYGRDVSRGLDLFRRVIGNNFIPGWNDAPERTQAEVLEAFDRAIALAEAGQ